MVVTGLTECGGSTVAGPAYKTHLHIIIVKPSSAELNKLKSA